MKVLLTGANGYIGKRLLPLLIDLSHHVICAVRDINRFHISHESNSQIEFLEIDLLDSNSLLNIPKDIDIAFYLVHSMSNEIDYVIAEKKSAINFRNALESTHCKQVIYLSGIVNDKILSKHLQSRLTVENELKKGKYATTVFRAGIIIGSGSASFEIIRDLVEKLPLMIAPKWLKTKSQPIAIRDVLSILSKSINNPLTYHQSFDIGGPEVLTYKEMLLKFAKVRHLRRFIFTIPVMTPKLSSYWLYFVTSTSFQLAKNLVESMKNNVVCKDNKINEILKITPISYEEAILLAFDKIESNAIISSWKDSQISGRLKLKYSKHIKIPTHGCLFYRLTKQTIDKKDTIERIWKIGGKNGWYYANFLWEVRGFIDQLIGGVGMRRGRTHQNKIHAGDTLDFWRVLYANKKEGRLVLYAEMKIPGEAWLEFKFNQTTLSQIATFRPSGLLGRLYWYSLYPFHEIIFKQMIRRL